MISRLNQYSLLGSSCWTITSLVQNASNRDFGELFKMKGCLCGIFSKCISLHQGCILELCSVKHLTAVLITILINELMCHIAPIEGWSNLQCIFWALKCIMKTNVKGKTEKNLFNSNKISNWIGLHQTVQMLKPHLQLMLKDPYFALY